MSKIIGLCGGSGSGKGFVGSFFTKNGYLVIDTDKVYRDITDNSSQCLDALVCEFGADIINDKGGLDRKRLAGLVFSDKNKLKILNAITHRFILDRVRSIIQNSASDGYAGFIVDAPLLFESGFDKECDLTICVIADEKIRIERIINRDGISYEAAKARINSQISNDELINKCTYSIENNSTDQKLRNEVADLYKTIFDN